MGWMVCPGALSLEALALPCFALPSPSDEGDWLAGEFRISGAYISDALYWTRDQAIDGHPRCIPGLNRYAAYKAFKAADLSAGSHRFGAAVYSAADASSIVNFKHSSAVLTN